MKIICKHRRFSIGAALYQKQKKSQKAYKQCSHSSKLMTSNFSHFRIEIVWKLIWEYLMGKQNGMNIFFFWLSTFSILVASHFHSLSYLLFDWAHSIVIDTTNFCIGFLEAAILSNRFFGVVSHTAHLCWNIFINAVLCSIVCGVCVCVFCLLVLYSHFAYTIYSVLHSVWRTLGKTDDDNKIRSHPVQKQPVLKKGFDERNL